ncbi:MAG TPA: hypothetical protein VKE51_22535 [Vicinamibacterales bacterium]|nr:hypothetical protein [Vicinamibacterales bacterium]
MRFGTLGGAATLIALLSTTQAFAQPFSITCAPRQRAVVGERFVRGVPVTSARCVDTSPGRAEFYRTRYRDVRPHRSWGKTALTIAGGAGTGAGIGGIVHGRKGALIGAALGGGAASLYESAKRR